MFRDHSRRVLNTILVVYVCIYIYMYLYILYPFQDGSTIIKADELHGSLMVRPQLFMVKPIF